MRRVRSPWTAALAATLMFALCGCGSLSAPPKDRFYRLAAVPAVASERTEGDGPLVYVAPLEASGLHAERAIVYAHDDGASLEQHGYHFWIDSPRVMFQHALAGRLAEDAGVRVVTMVTPEADYVIRGRIERFEQTGDRGGGAVAVALRAYEGTRAATPFLERTYARTEGGDGTGVRSSVSAIGVASSAIVDEFVAAFDAALARWMDSGAHTP